MVSPEVKPSINPVRRIPLVLYDDLKSELNKIEKNQGIKRVYEPTQWESSIISPQKKERGQSRVCIDPKHLNTERKILFASL